MLKGIIVAVKFGGSVITNKSRAFTPRIQTMDRLASEVHNFNGRSGVRLIVAHGGGSFPHVYAKKYKIHLGGLGQKFAEGVSRVQDSASRLNRLVVTSLLKAGENPISIQPSASIVAEDSRIVKWDTAVIERALDFDLTPVPYGDVALDERRGCSILSTEEIIRYLSMRLPIKKVIIGSKENGVLDKRGLVIQKITPSNLNSILECAKGSSGIDVTGGMRSKILTLLEMVKANERVECSIINVARPGNLAMALEGHEVEGTRICAK
jgi:isopentenyl phosphate kinase